jgi:hypothetical protein
MMRCATPVQFWAFSSASGSTRLSVPGLSVGAEGATCTGSQYIVLSQTEFDQFTVSPFRLSLDEASAISGAILLCWAAGWGVRMIVRVLRDSSDVEPD